MLLLFVMNGYAGSILRLNLTEQQVSTIPTADYNQWGGGHGMGSAIFFDLVADKTIDGFDPKNVVTIMTSPLTGTVVPGASGRTEVQGGKLLELPSWRPARVELISGAKRQTVALQQ